MFSLRVRRGAPSWSWCLPLHPICHPTLSQSGALSHLSLCPGVLSPLPGLSPPWIYLEEGHSTFLPPLILLESPHGGKQGGSPGLFPLILIFPGPGGQKRDRVSPKASAEVGGGASSTLGTSPFSGWVGLMMVGMTVSVVMMTQSQRT